MTDSKQQLSTSSSSDKANNLFNIDLFSDKPQLEEEAPENKVVSRRLFPFMKKSSIETNDTSAICPIDEEYISKNINENINEDNIEEDVLNESELNFPKIDCDISIDTPTGEDIDTEENKKLLKHLISLAKEQSTCRYLQQKIDSEHRLANEYFFSTILSSIQELIVNQFGNYLIQKIIEYISDDQIYEIVTEIRPTFYEICTNFYGTRVLQKMISYITTERTMNILLDIIKNFLPKMINDINASHIIIKLLSLKKKTISTSIYEMINMGIITISTHKHGCCLIQKIIDGDLENTESIVNNLINNALTLINHQYGNYAVQYILSMNNDLYSFRLIMVLLPSLPSLSKSKYSSTVIERCFEKCNESLRVLLYDIIMKKNVMNELICDRFGNYVIQKAIDTADEERQRRMIAMIIPMVEMIRREPFGRQLYVKLYNKYMLFADMTKRAKYV